LYTIEIVALYGKIKSYVPLSVPHHRADRGGSR